MRKLLISLTLFTVLILVGCNNEAKHSEEPYLTGYVMDKRSQKLLIVSTEAEENQSTERTEETYRAVWSAKPPNHVKVGEQVNVWYEAEFLLSDPPEATISEIEVLPSAVPEGADLSDTEALNQALAQETVKNKILTVKSIVFDPDKDEWSIALKTTNPNNTGNHEEFTLLVEDT